MTSYQSASNARMFIRYCNGKTTTSKMSVQVDAKTYEVEFPPSGSWDKWDTVYVDDVWLDACDFDLKFTALTSDGGPNVDVVGFDIKDVYRIGAEPVENPESSSSAQNPGVESSGSESCEDENCDIQSIRRNVRPNNSSGRGYQINLLGRSVNGKSARGVYIQRQVR